jgi:hypothetical protein
MRGKQNIIVALIGVPIGFVTLLLLGLFGFIGLRSTEIIEREYLRGMLRQISHPTGSSLLVDSYDSTSEYPSVYPSLNWMCNTSIRYLQIYYTDEPLDQIYDHYRLELARLTGSNALNSSGGIVANGHQTTLWVGETTLMETSQFVRDDLVDLITDEILYTVSAYYGTDDCFDLP